MGYPTGIKGYKLLDFNTHELFISKDVVFHETNFPFKTTNATGFSSDPFDTLALPRLDHPLSLYTEHTSTSTPLLPDITQEPDTHITNHVPTTLPSRKSSRQIKKPSYLHDYHCNLAYHKTHTSQTHPYPISNVLGYDSLSESYKSYILNITMDIEPKFYHQAVKFPEWKQAMDDKIKA